MILVVSIICAGLFGFNKVFLCHCLRNQFQEYGGRNDADGQRQQQ